MLVDMFWSDGVVLIFFGSTQYDVLGSFIGQIRQIERQKRLRSFEAVTNQIRHVELRGLQPELSLGCSSLEFGDVYYRREAAAVLRVANVGQG